MRRKTGAICGQYVPIQGIMFADVVAIRDVLLHPQQSKPREHGLKVIHVIRSGVSGVAAQVKAAGIYRAQSFRGYLSSSAYQGFGCARDADSQAMTPLPRRALVRERRSFADRIYKMDRITIAGLAPPCQSDLVNPVNPVQLLENRRGAQNRM